MGLDFKLAQIGLKYLQYFKFHRALSSLPKLKYVTRFRYFSEPEKNPSLKIAKTRIEKNLFLNYRKFGQKKDGFWPNFGQNFLSNPYTQKSSNKLRMKALEGWNTFYQHSKLNSFDSFLNQDKNYFEIGTQGKLRSINDSFTIHTLH